MRLAWLTLALVLAAGLAGFNRPDPPAPARPTPS